MRTLAQLVVFASRLSQWMGSLISIAAMLAAFAFAAFLGLPSFFAVVCPGAAKLFLGGENDFHANMPVAFAFAALMGWPSCFGMDSPAVLAALSGGYANTGSAGYVCLETVLVDRSLISMRDACCVCLCRVFGLALVVRSGLSWCCEAMLCYAALSH